MVIEKEEHAILFLASLPASYEHFVETLMYGRDTLSMDGVLAALTSRELKKRSESKNDGEGLTVRGRSDQRFDQKTHKSRGQSRSKSKFKISVMYVGLRNMLKENSQN